MNHDKEMKNINKQLGTECEIKSWLDQMEVKKYKIVPDKRHGFVVNVKNT